MIRFKYSLCFFIEKKLWLYLYQTKLKGIVFYNPRSSESLESYRFHRQQHYGRIYHINLLTGIVQIFKSDNKDLKDYRGQGFVAIRNFSNRTIFTVTKILAIFIQIYRPESYKFLNLITKTWRIIEFVKTMKFSNLTVFL